MATVFVTLLMSTAEFTVDNKPCTCTILHWEFKVSIKHAHVKGYAKQYLHQGRDGWNMSKPHTRMKTRNCIIIMCSPNRNHCHLKFLLPPVLSIIESEKYKGGGGWWTTFGKIQCINETKTNTMSPDGTKSNCGRSGSWSIIQCKCLEWESW